MTLEGYIRVASVSPKVAVADVKTNTAEIIATAREAAGKGARVVVFPELCITGYTCADLFHSSTLLSAASEGIVEIARNLADIDTLVVVGAPIEADGAVYNCAVALYAGRVWGAISKKYIPNYNEFYEKRWWASAPEAPLSVSLPHGTKLTIYPSALLSIGGVKIGVEICEDLWVPIPPSCHMALEGAQIVANLSASDDLIGKYGYLRSLLAQQSARCICGYVYASAGYGESSTDLVFNGKTLIYENGSCLAANERWRRGNQMVIADIDIDAIDRDRRHMGSFADCARSNATSIPVIEVHTGTPKVEAPLMRHVDPHPFVPADDDKRMERCREIINIQTAALSKRLEHTHCRSLVVGISGGLDSTLALLVAVNAFDSLGLDRKGIVGVTMPGFGTSKRTKGNAFSLMEGLGITIREIPIAPAVSQHFKDIEHDPEVHDITYENSQARYRTMLLMDIANQTGGMVLGTGDLSELALGWATYNGDHMSMYGVNTGVPKTLVKYLVETFAAMPEYASVAKVLLDIVATPVSPELLPAEDGSDDNPAQITEDTVGPYELHDFFLYYMLRYGFAPTRIYQLACQAFASSYTPEVIKRWLVTFYRRFFAQQFKRSCLPDGPKVGSVCLSPRGDWRMPSDASGSLWINEAENVWIAS